jgi:DNA polymerase I
VIPFREAWCVDFEFRADPGERPYVVCMVAKELHSGREIWMWRDELLALRRAPFDTSADAALVAYYASAELGCFLELGWPLPVNVIDLFVEHRVETNGKKLPCGNGLLGALAVRGLAHIDASEKEAMRQLVMTRWEWTEEERRAILNYCYESDVVGLIALLPVMAPTIDWPRALLRGRYMAAVARMERNGIPVDAALHRRLVANWGAIKRRLIAEVDKAYGVYDGTTFKRARFAQYLQANRIPWRRLPSGGLALDDNTFDEAARSHPQLLPLYELRSTLSRLRLVDIPVGADHRARCLLSPFRSTSGRNQPGGGFLFGPARWIRGLGRSREGWAIAYIDWSTQEIAIAAGRSGDENMIADYLSGDVYLAFLKANGLAPADATKESHADIREVAKQIVLGVLYGMGPETMALKAGISVGEARELLRLHKRRYATFWRWSESTVTTALFTGEMQTVFGWRRHVGKDVSARSLMNFPMQAHGAEMMRLAAIAATEAGIEVCCPVHDAFLITAPVDRIDADVAAMRAIMSKAGRAITGGLDVRTDVKIVHAPDRYMDPRGAGMWGTVMNILERLDTEGTGSHEREPNLLISDTVPIDVLTSENGVQDTVALVGT